MKGGEPAVNRSRLPNTMLPNFFKKYTGTEKNNSVESTDYELQNIINNTFPNTLLLINEQEIDNRLYEIPILINDFDLQFLKIDKEIFDKNKEKIKERNKKIKERNENFIDSFTDIVWDQLYAEYIFIINNPNDYILIINLFLLLQANSEKSYFQRQDFHVKPKKKILKQTGGGIFDNIKRLFNYDYQLASGYSQYIEGGFNTISIFTSIEAINYFLNTQMTNTTILAMTILIETIGVRNCLSSLKPIANVAQTVTESNLPLQVARRMNNIISFVSINSETLDEYFKKSKQQLLTNVSETIRGRVATYNSSKYSDPMTKIVPISYDIIKGEIINFQTKFFGTLTEVNENLTCLVCDQKFSYFDDDKYIRQELDPLDIESEIAELKRLDPNLIIDETLKKKIKQQLEYYCKLNIFPCKQLIESSSIKKYNTNDISKYICSNCCLEQLNHTDEVAWPFYLGASTDNIRIGVDKIQELIQYLSPTELNTIFNKKYLDHRLSCIKFNQIKMNITAKGGDPNPINFDDDVDNNRIINIPNDNLLQVECPMCEQKGTVGRFFRVFKKNNAELLYLHCNRCGTSFNGCDKQSPYIIDQTQFDLFQENDDICTFIEKIKLSKRRQNGRARISMEKYKEIKRKEFLDNTVKQIQDDNKPYEKHCPNCNILIDNEVGCSAMTCAACRHKFCYVCCKSVDQNSHGGHDTNHFLVNMEQPLGGWFGIQCVNVHFSIPQGYIQNINGNPFVPNIIKDEFKELTNITKHKYEYLRDKYDKLGYDDQLVKQLIIGQSDTWRQMDSVYYSKQNGGVCYEQGDLHYDPDVLVKKELKLFLQRCDRGDVEPIVPCNMVNEGDILEIIDENGLPLSQPPEPEPPLPPAPEPPLPPAPAVAVEPQPPLPPEVAQEQQREQLPPLPPAIEQQEPAQYVDLDIEDEDVQNIILEGLIRNNVPNNLQIIGPEQQRNIENNLELLQRIIAENNQNEIDLQIAIHLGQAQQQQQDAAELQQQALPLPPPPQEEETLKNEIQSWFDVYHKAKITHFFIHEDFEGECNIVLAANIDYRAMVIVNDQGNEINNNNNDKKFYFSYNLRDYWDTDELKDELEIPMTLENLKKFVTFFNTDVFNSLKIGMHGLFRDKNYLKFMKKKYNISVSNDGKVSLEKLENQPAQRVGGKNKRSKLSSTFKRKNNKRKTKKHYKKSKRNHKSNKSKTNKKAKKSKRKY